MKEGKTFKSEVNKKVERRIRGTTGWLPASFLESKMPAQKRDNGIINAGRKI
jgi:hypothetical protein